jgi:hypothetical protein
LALVACAGLVAATGLITNCASISGLSGGEHGADAGDAAGDGSAPPSDTGSVTDTTSEPGEDALDTGAPDAVDASDTSPGDSAGPDVTDADAGADCGTWCSCQTPPHKLCNDFDDGLLFNDPLWPLSASTMATVTLDDGGVGNMLDYVSPPYSAHFSVGAIVSGTSLSYNTVIPNISHQVLGAVTQLTCAMDLLMLNESPIPGTFVDPLALQVATPAGTETLLYSVGIGGATVVAFGGDTTQFSQSLPLEVGWTRYWLSFAPNAADAGGGYEVQAGAGDGGPSVTWASPPSLVNSGFTIQIGIPDSFIGNGNWDVLIDNVTCDW